MYWRAAILQMTVSKVFFWMKPSVILTRNEHWFRQWLGEVQVTNQWTITNTNDDPVSWQHVASLGHIESNIVYFNYPCDVYWLLWTYDETTQILLNFVTLWTQVSEVELATRETGNLMKCVVGSVPAMLHDKHGCDIKYDDLWEYFDVVMKMFGFCQKFPLNLGLYVIFCVWSWLMILLIIHCHQFDSSDGFIQSRCSAMKSTKFNQWWSILLY